jgi:hypothetical protein
MEPGMVVLPPPVTNGTPAYNEVCLSLRELGEKAKRTGTVFGMRFTGRSAVIIIETHTSFSVGPGAEWDHEFSKVTGLAWCEIWRIKEWTREIEVKLYDWLMERARLDEYTVSEWRLVDMQKEVQRKIDSPWEV